MSLDEESKNWKPTHNIDSRPGLITGEIGNIVKEQSVMKESYVIPKKPEIPHGRRRALLKQFLWQHLAQKLSKEMFLEFEQKDKAVSSEYQDNFNVGGFVPECFKVSSDPKVEEYPLYTDMGRSVYFDKMCSQRPKDPTAVFRKRSFFARPFYDELE